MPAKLRNQLISLLVDQLTSDGLAGELTQATDKPDRTPYTLLPNILYLSNELLVNPIPIAWATDQLIN